MQIRIDGREGEQITLKGVRAASHERLRDVSGLDDARLPKGTTLRKQQVEFPCPEMIVVTVTTEKHPAPEHILTAGAVVSLTNGGSVLGSVSALPEGWQTREEEEPDDEEVPAEGEEVVEPKKPTPLRKGNKLAKKAATARKAR